MMSSRQDRTESIRWLRVVRAVVGAVLAVSGVGLCAGAVDPYVHETVHEPVKDLIRLDVPEELGNRRLAEMGFVDVTAAPFGADASGREDCTAALQAAIDFARDHQMVCWLPAGTYRVSDTLQCVQGYYRRQHGKVLGAPNFPCVVMGERKAGRRPQVVLAAHSAGYGDPQRPKYVVHYWTRMIDQPQKPQPNICFYQMWIGVDIEIGEGNPGAVGIRLRGAQGSGVQDCTIDARHGHMGLEGGCGSGGSHVNVEVIGGRIGMDLRQTQPAPTITGVRLTGQTDAAIVYGGRQSLCAVGVEIECPEGTTPIRIEPEWDVFFLGPVTLVDARIEFTQANAHNIVVAGDRGVYLRDVYVSGAGQVCEGDGRQLPDAGDAWVHVREYARADGAAEYRGLQYTRSVYADGRERERVLADFERVDRTDSQLRRRHVWGGDFAGWETVGAVNVKEPPYRAKGDARADDTAALQRAIDENEVVLLPKGIYRVSRTLRLRENTKLVGTGRMFSVIAADNREGFFADALNPRPVVETADAAGARTVMAFCAVYVPSEMPGAYALNWRSGRESICRDVNFLLMPAVGYGARTGPHDPRGDAFVRVSGHGGGRWYNFELGLGLQEPGYRQMLVEGTSEPLRIYQCNPEGARSEANMEIRGARHVCLYGVKGEGNSPVLWVRGCEDIAVYGYGGNASAAEGKALFLVEDTTGLALANLVETPMPVGKEAIRGAMGTDPKRWHMVIQRTGDGRVVRTPPLERPVLYKHGSHRSSSQ